MKKRKKRRLVIRAISFCLVLVMMLGILLSNVVIASADSNDRIAVFIHLAADGETTDEDTNEITESELRFLGMYLSNFYVPFGTEIGTEADGELAKTTKEDMVSTMMTKLAYSEEMSNNLVDIIFGYTRSSLKDLEIYASEKQGEGPYVKVNLVAPNYYNFLRLMMGRPDDVFRKYSANVDLSKGTAKNIIASNMTEKKKKTYKDLSSSEKDACDVFYDIFDGKYDYLNFGYGSGSSFKAVADCYIGGAVMADKNSSFGGKYTASQVAFMKCLESCDLAQGYGYSFMDFSPADEVDEDAMKKLCSDTNDKTKFTKMSILGTTMAVDCFGDIIALGGNHQVVLVPGCMNPYAWRAVDFEGKDRDDAPPGVVYNIANAMTMTQLKVDTSGGRGKNEFLRTVDAVGVNDVVVSIDGDSSSSTNSDSSNSSSSSSSSSVSSSLSSDSSSESSSSSSNGFSRNPVLKLLTDITNSIVDVSGRNVDINGGNGLISGKANFIAMNTKIDDGDLAGKWSVFNGQDTEYGVVAIRHQRGSKNCSFGVGGLGTSYDRQFYMNAQEGFQKMYAGDRTWYYSTTSGGDSGEVVGVSISPTASFDCVLPHSTGPTPGGKYKYGATMRTSRLMFRNVVLIDNLGAYKDKEYRAFNVAPFIDDNGSVESDAEDANFRSDHNFGSIYSGIKEGKMDVPEKASEMALSTLYVTYCWACLYDDSAKADTIGRLGYRANIEGLPDMDDKPILLSELGEDGEGGTDVQKQAIQNWIYYLLHPTDGFYYVMFLISNKVNHILLGWHGDMVGTNGTGVTVGITKYRSEMGFVTMPDLSEIEWTNSLIGFYNECIPVLIVVLLIIMLFAFVTGALDMQHAIAGLLLFSIFTLIPVNLINGVVEQSNRISQNIYGNKFTYWALVQQESYSSAIDSAANGDSYENYLRTLYSENEQVYTNQGSESIVVKWQAPKKMASLVLTQADAKSLNGLSTVGQKMLYGMLNKTYSGQSYVDDEEAIYMYRSYLDISNFSRYIYDGIDKEKVKSYSVLSGKGTTVGTLSTANWEAFKDTTGNIAITGDIVKEDYEGYLAEGYSNGVNFNTELDADKQFYLTVPLSSKIIEDVLPVRGTLDTFSNSDDRIPINSDVFNFGIPQFNGKADFSPATFEATGNIVEATRKADLEDYMSHYVDEDYVGLAAYGLYSENPYYYFSWKLYSDGLKPSSADSNYKNLVLGRANGAFFYNTDGNEELKDFMNMRGLFYYIIPYMKQLNDIVREWDDIYGIFIYDGVPTEEGHWNEVGSDPELATKYWHNLNVTRLYDIYCPWVDLMYDCSYADSETIKVMGKKVTISDPINPYSYPEDRPMIFSASEMADYGLTEGDLTKVERLILKCNEQFEERLYDLLNYYNFSDVSINSAAAINCAFVFNNTFSENGIFKENHNIYPQSFDLSNFSFDAFLRFMLSNATGESMLANVQMSDTRAGKTSGDFYERVVNNSSVATVIVMLVLDILSMYLIPAVRIFFLISLFLASILLVLVSAFNIEDNAKFIKKVVSQLFLPLLYFFGATIGFAMLISLFMGVGNNKVTQDVDMSISMGDPVVTMLIVTVLDIILLIIYVKILIQILKDMKHSSKLVSGFVSGLGGAVSGMASSAFKAIGGTAGALGSIASGAIGLGSKIQKSRRRKKSEKNEESVSDSLDTIASNTSKMIEQQGTGIESSRANERGSSRKSSDFEDISPHLDDALDDRRRDDVDVSVETKEVQDAKRDRINAMSSESGNNSKDGSDRDKVDLRGNKKADTDKSGDKGSNLNNKSSS